MFISRNLPLEEFYVRFTFGPIFAADGITVKGIFCPCTETTEQCIAERRSVTLGKLGVLVDRTSTASFVSQKATEILSQNPYDVTFAVVYLLDEQGEHAILTASTGLRNLNAFPVSVLIDEKTKPGLHNVQELTTQLQEGFWPISTVLSNHKEEHMNNLCSLGLELPGGQWPEYTNQVILLPIQGGTDGRSAGVLILGISPRCVFDDSYRSFMSQVARHISILIIEAKTYEAERKRSQALIELDQAKTSFFSNISHEFRTPLTLMLGPIEDVLNCSDDTVALQGENLKVVYRNSLRLLKLVNNLLDFSRIEAKPMQARFEPTDLATFTSDLASNFRSAIEKAGLSFKVDCSSVTEPIYIDPDLWEKIVLNLLSNAFKFTLEGTIEVKLEEVNNKTIALIVRDTGTGIAAHELPHIFKRFHRIKGARGRTHEGSGIGLALVQELVGLHKGEIQVFSELNKGTTFSVFLQKGSNHLPQEQLSIKNNPRAYLTKENLFIAEAMRWSLPEVIASKPQNKGTSNARILIVDDNNDMREYLSHLLSQYWVIETVSNGQLALEKIINGRNELEHKPRYDLIILDVMMPELDGFQLLDILKGNPSTHNIPVIMLSARAGEEARIEGLQSGADDYLIKPFSAKELISRVQTLLELTRQRSVLVHELNIMNHLHSIATRFVQEAEVSEIFLEIIDAAMAISNADKGSILLVDEENKNLKISASRGFDVPFLDYFASCPPGEGACGTALQNHERVVIYDITEDPRFIATPYLEQLLAKEIYSVQATPLKSRTGKVLGILATYYKIATTPKSRELQMVDLLARLSADIIERGQWLAERGMLVEKLRKADKRKNEFLALLSHELRNPLASISNSSMLLSYNSSGCKTVKNAQTIINRQVAQITRLVDDLLDITRITENKIQLEFQKIDINELVFRIAEDNRPVFERAGLSLKLQLADSPVLINGDALRIEQVINNLLHNASKFSTNGGMTQVIVDMGDNRDEVVIYIIDDGIGIAPSFKDHLFEPFTQADNSLGRKQTRLGLGLALVKGLIELHHGSVEVISPGLDLGTTFILRLPMLEHSEQQALIHQQEAIKPILSRTILIIDDNADIRESLSLLLEGFGHKVYVASSGLAGITEARKVKPDCVLCDIGLPEFNGYQVAATIRADSDLCATYLIALSGYAQPEEIDKALKAGFDIHLAKPPNFDLLENILYNFKNPLAVD